MHADANDAGVRRIASASATPTCERTRTHTYRCPHRHTHASTHTHTSAHGRHSPRRARASMCAIGGRHVTHLLCNRTLSNLYHCCPASYLGMSQKGIPEASQSRDCNNAPMDTGDTPSHLVQTAPAGKSRRRKEWEKLAPLPNSSTGSRTLQKSGMWPQGTPRNGVWGVAAELGPAGQFSQVPRSWADTRLRNLPATHDCGSCTPQRHRRRSGGRSLSRMLSARHLDQRSGPVRIE
jgi:hypothetical protein